MTQTLFCPACGLPVPVLAAVCPHCGAPVPGTSTHGVRPARPGFITVLMIFLTAWAVLGLFVSPMMLYGPAGEYRINDELVTREEFQKTAMLPIILAQPFLLAGLCAAWALWRERAWGRRAVVGLVTTSALLPGVGAMFLSGIPSVIPMVMIIGGVMYAAPAFWYFYRKRNVVSYYRFLKERG